MSSTGNISPVIVGPMTTFAEGQRQASALPEMPGAYLQQVDGIIREVHEENLLVKVYTLKGMRVAGDSWIALAHSPAEIAERFGTVRQGMRVRVSYTGPDAAGASATITGVEGSKGPEEEFAENTLKRNIYAIFTPGV